MNYSNVKNSAFNIIKKNKIKKIHKEPKNKECFECSKLYPEYISLNNGIFLCKDCAINHLNFPKQISTIIKNDLDNLSVKNIQYLCFGGNRNLIEFINRNYPYLKTLSPINFYQTKEMDYYRKYLEYLIEGGIKPIKPNIDKANEIIIQKNLYNNNNFNNLINLRKEIINLSKSKSQNFSILNNDSYSKINKNVLYPKIKPIVGRKNKFRFTRSLSRHNNKLGLPELKSQSSNFNNLNNSLNNEKLNSSSSDFNYQYYSLFKNNYDTDGNYDDINDIKENELNEQINNLTNLNELNELDKLKVNINNINTNFKLHNKIHKRNRDSSIKVLKINHNSTNNISKNIYEKPLYQKYLNTFQNDENKTYYKNESLLNVKQIKNTISNKNKTNHIFSIEDLRNYLNKNKHSQKDKNIFNMKQNLNKSINIKNKQVKEKKHKRSVNNINNNIIINKNINENYINLKNIFKKNFRK